MEIEIDSLFIAEAVAHRILKSNREMIKIAGRMATEMLKSTDIDFKSIVAAAITARVREEFNSHLQCPRYGLQSPQTVVDMALRTLSSDFTKELRALMTSRIHSEVEAVVKEELQKRLSTFTNDELLRLIGK